MIVRFSVLKVAEQLLKPIKCQCCPHIETSQLICKANQLTGFYMRATLAFNGLITKNKFSHIQKISIDF